MLERMRRKELPCGLVIPLLGKTMAQKESCTPVLTAAPFAITETQKQPEYLLQKSGWRGCVAHIYDGILRSLFREWNNTICSNMGAAGDQHTRWSKLTIGWYHLGVESKKVIQLHLFTKQKQTHRLRKQTYSYQWDIWGGLNWEIGINIHALLYLT